MPAATPTPRQLLVELDAALAAGADPQRAAQQQRYMKSAMPYYGLTSPELRAAVRPILDRFVPTLADHDDWEAAIRGVWDGATHRELRYAALALARHRGAARFRAEGALDLYRHLIETGAWWDFVDEVATHLVRDELLADPPRVAAVMRAWAVDGDLWVRRAAILCQIGAGGRLDQALLADVIVANLEGSPSAGPGGRHDFFIRKANGWALRDHARRQPAWVGTFVAEHRPQMSGISVREALKHVIHGGS